MSEVYVLEPPTTGKVVLRTTHGDLDVELWAKECPKACRNFVQLCIDGYYDDTIFHRIVKDFVIQGGDPTGTGRGGRSIYHPEPLPVERHPRLMFRYRGMIGLAALEGDDIAPEDRHGSQFFITLGRSDSFNGKYTLFAKITGNTLYNLVNIADVSCNKEGRPVQTPPRILSASIIRWLDEALLPRKGSRAWLQAEKQNEPRRSEPSGARDHLKEKKRALLSFNDDDDEEAEDSLVAPGGNDRTESLSPSEKLERARDLSTHKGSDSTSDSNPENREIRITQIPAMNTVPLSNDPLGFELAEKHGNTEKLGDTENPGNTEKPGNTATYGKHSTGFDEFPQNPQLAAPGESSLVTDGHSSIVGTSAQEVCQPIETVSNVKNGIKNPPSPSEPINAEAIIRGEEEEKVRRNAEAIDEEIKKVRNEILMLKKEKHSTTEKLQFEENSLQDSDLYDILERRRRLKSSQAKLPSKRRRAADILHKLEEFTMKLKKIPAEPLCEEVGAKESNSWLSGPGLEFPIDSNTAYQYDAARNALVSLDPLASRRKDEKDEIARKRKNQQLKPSLRGKEVCDW